MYQPQFFTLPELCKSDYRYSQNIPSFADVQNLVNLCANVLDPLRVMLNCPIIVNSGFRNEQVNKNVGGVNNSFHLRGMAADICCHTVPAASIAQLIKDHFPYTELGLYYSFVHVAFDPQHIDKQFFCKVR